VNANNDVVLGVSGSNSSEYASAYFTGRASSDASGLMAVPVIYKAGEGPYNDGNGPRWGDYSLTSVDPTDNLTFWTIQEYARTGGGSWGTYIAQLEYTGFVDCNGNGIDDAVDIANGTSLDCDGNGVPDECQPDCNSDGTPDVCEVDCNADGIPDDCQSLGDCNSNGIPDVCEGLPDCDGDGLPDVCEIDANGNGIPDDCEFADFVANGEQTVAGTRSGTYVSTQTANVVYESIREIESSGSPSQRYSYLDHRWTFNLTGGGSSLALNVKAYRTNSSDGDNFAFAYSTDNVTFTTVLTVTRTSDNGTYQTASLPANLTGPVWIRVVDTDRTPGHRSRDRIFVDHLYIHQQ
jgi:hypothetical protein